MALTCAVKDCSNSTYWLYKWKKQLCDLCGCLHKEKNCTCDPPFRLFTFPTSKKDPEGRKRWKQLVDRKDGSKLWSPSKDSRVCSEHFVDGEPTLQNSLPTLKLGYKGFEERVRRMNFFSTRPAPPVAVMDTLQHTHRKEEESTEDPPIEVMERNMCPELPWYMWLICLLLCLLRVLTEYEKKMTDLTREVEELKAQVQALKTKKYVHQLLKTDDDVTFYTGLKSKHTFDKLHAYISPLVNRRWTGVHSMAKNIRKFSKASNRFGPGRKLTSGGEFLLTLMKLRLGLLNKDLARRFDISAALCSRIFFAWLRACSSVLHSLIFIPDEET